MKWFKHYCESHEGQTISELWAENDTEAIAFYWTVLEMVSRWESENNRGTWFGNLSIFRSKLGMKSQRSHRLLSKICQRFNIELEWVSDESFKLFIPKWLELQENRGGKKHSKTTQNANRSKKEEVRSKMSEVRQISDDEKLIEKKNSVQNFDARFNESFQEMMKDLSAIDLDGIGRKHPSLLLQVFQNDPNNLKTFLRGVATTAQEQKVPTNKWNAYCANSLRDRLGVK